VCTTYLNGASGASLVALAMARVIFLLTWHCNEKAIDYCIVALYLEQSVVCIYADSNVGGASSHMECVQIKGVITPVRAILSMHRIHLACRHSPSLAGPCLVDQIKSPP